MNTIKYLGQPLSVNKIICVGRNYTAHIEELGNAVPDEMVLFMKPNSAIGNQLSATHLGDAIHFETEICFVIKEGQYAGVSVGLDLTKRDVQSKLKKAGLPWERAKAFAGAALFAPFVELTVNANRLNLVLEIDGNIQQQGNVPMMIYPPAMILAECSKHFSLSDNDVIMSGTPEGVGQLVSGQTLLAKLFADKTLLTEISWKVA